MITTKIVIITIIISIIAFFNRNLMDIFLFYPYRIHHNNEWFRFITAGFIHGGVLHLLINMWVLYIFGIAIENSLSMIFVNDKLHFVILYFGGMIFSSLIPYFKNKNNPQYMALGASGAISAIVFAFILLYPTEKLIIFPIPIGIPAWVFGIFYLIFSYYQSKRSKDNIAHDVHFYGSLFGILYLTLVKPAIFLHFINAIF